MKPPFRLAHGADPDGLHAALADLAARTAPAQAETPLGRFLAPTCPGDTSGVDHVAAACVTGLDRFRAPPDADELSRRRKPGQSVRQEALLTWWGYPHVLGQFRFHMTLTGRLPKPDLPGWAALVSRHLPPLPAPFYLDEVALVGERADGMFQLIERVRLRG